MFLQLLTNVALFNVTDDLQGLQKQGPQKLNSLKALKIQKPPLIPGISTLLQSSEMSSLSNFRWQTIQERLNRSKYNEDMAETAKRYVVCEWHPS